MRAEIGEAFKTSAFTLPGYAYQGLSADSAAETGRYGFQDRTVTYVYKTDASTASSAGTVLIRYIDLDGNTVSSDMLVNSEVGSIYSVNRRSVLGYRLSWIEGDENVTITNSVQVVNVIYEHATYTASSVVVKYLDTEGNTIRPDDVYNGDDGEAYSVKPAYIKGYKFLKIYEEKEEEEAVEKMVRLQEMLLAEEEDLPEQTTVPGQVEGVFKPQMLQIITYIYNQFTDIDTTGDGEPNVNIVDKDGEGKPDVDSVSTGDRNMNAYVEMLCSAVFMILLLEILLKRKETGKN